MTPRRLRQLLIISSAICWLLAAAVVVISLNYPLPEYKEVAGLSLQLHASVENLGVTERAAIGSVDFDALVERRYQQPIFDPPPPVEAPAAPAPPPTPPQLQLVATMLDPTGHQAMLKDATGRTRFSKIGSRISGGTGDAEVTAIDEASVTVEFNGLTFVLSIPQ